MRTGFGGLAKLSQAKAGATTTAASFVDANTTAAPTADAPTTAAAGVSGAAAMGGGSVAAIAVGSVVGVAVIAGAVFAVFTLVAARKAAASANSEAAAANDLLQPMGGISPDKDADAVEMFQLADDEDDDL